MVGGTDFLHSAAVSYSNNFNKLGFIMGILRPFTHSQFIEDDSADSIDGENGTKTGRNK